MEYWKTKYQLAKDLYFEIPHWPYDDIVTDLIEVKTYADTTILVIKKYWCYDGPSGPAIDTDNFMEPSAAHDALYWLMRWKLIPIEYKTFADNLMYELCLENGMSKIRAKYCCWAVKRFAKKAANEAGKRIIYKTEKD